MSKANKHIILCNGAGYKKKRNEPSPLILSHEGKDQNICIKLPQFIKQTDFLPPRVKDLIELASFIYSADRKTSRGSYDDLEYQSWSRDMHFVVKVRDIDFWSDKNVTTALSDALQFMSGDKRYSFTFLPGRTQSSLTLFDKEEFSMTTNIPKSILLFSGGLDSFTGTIERLKTTDEEICLISHLSGQPGTNRTQKALVRYLNDNFNNRCKHFKFTAHLTTERGIEETQRTRSLLYSTIAFALCIGNNVNEFYFYENGITSLNFPKRQNMILARASRTTHPKTLGLLAKFFSIVANKTISIRHPYLFLSKTDVVKKLQDYNVANTIDSTVSCSKTFQNTSQSTHCGTCSQCIDRRFAVYASGLEDYDPYSLYNFNFLKDNYEDMRAKTTVIDYIRQAKHFYEYGIDKFYKEYLDSLLDIIDYIEGNNENEKIEKIYFLSKRHGEQIIESIKRIRGIFDEFKEVKPNSLQEILNVKPFLKNPSELLANKLSETLKLSIGTMFRKNKPMNENDMNDKVHGLLKHFEDDYKREFLTVSFGLAKVIPDHQVVDVLIESKYLRENTTPSVATDGISSDLIKYPEQSFKLFLVYDPSGSIKDDEMFCKAFEQKGNCKVTVIR